MKKISLTLVKKILSPHNKLILLKLCLFRGENLDILSNDELESLEKDLNKTIKKIYIQIEMNKNPNDLEVNGAKESIER